MNDSQEYKLQDVTADKIMQAVEASWNKREEGVDTKFLAKYLEKTERYARSALSCALQLNLLVKRDDRYFISESAIEVSRATKNQYRIVFGRSLVKYPPFVLFVSQIGRGDSLEEAGRKTATVFEIGLNADRTRRVLSGWGIYSDLLEQNQEGKLLVKVKTNSLSVEIIEELLEAMKSELNIRTYIAQRVGDYSFRLLDKSIDHIVSAVMNHRANPRHSIDDSGRAFENYLRIICKSIGIDDSNSNGIIELSQKIYSEKKMDNKHRELCEGIGSVRNAATHSMDKKTSEIWTINPEGAIEIALLTLTMIRSIHLYAFDNGLFVF
ncbi:MAG: hypothetical protein JW779_05565 [Candidatus Thorarchaeota archaeon]|nr:hypothetical protein [Candidatus Thorarchaeota archaeon]